MPLLTPTWNWQAEGFRAPPTARESRPGECLLRVWGGRATMRGSPKRVGVCFSNVAPTSRYGAESLFSVFEWGNTCENVTQFLIPATTILWLGEVDPGQAGAPLGLRWGPQIFIENPAAQMLVPTHTRKLANDMGNSLLYLGRMPSVYS
jgi:hypothetical protein